MTSKFKVLTDNTPPLSLDASIEVGEPPSKRLASSDNTPNSTPISSLPSENTSTTDTGDWKITEKSRQQAMIMKVVLSRLEKAGLVRRYKVLSKDDNAVVKEYQIVFDPKLWTETLELQSTTLLSEET